MPLRHAPLAHASSATQSSPFETSAVHTVVPGSQRRPSAHPPLVQRSPALGKGLHVPTGPASAAARAVAVAALAVEVELTGTVIFDERLDHHGVAERERVGEMKAEKAGVELAAALGFVRTPRTGRFDLHGPQDGPRRPQRRSSTRSPPPSSRGTRRTHPVSVAICRRQRRAPRARQACNTRRAARRGARHCRRRRPAPPSDPCPSHRRQRRSQPRGLP